MQNIKEPLSRWLDCSSRRSLIRIQKAKTVTSHLISELPSKNFWRRPSEVRIVPRLAEPWPGRSLRRSTTDCSRTPWPKLWSEISGKTRANLLETWKGSISRKKAKDTSHWGQNSNRIITSIHISFKKALPSVFVRSSRKNIWMWCNFPSQSLRCQKHGRRRGENGWTGSKLPAFLILLKAVCLAETNGAS